MAEDFDSPVDIATAEVGLSGLWLLGVAMGVALFVLALFNAHALAAWADTLEPGERSARIGAAAHGLASKTAARGLDGPRAALHDEWETVKAARWPGQQDPDQR
jgi:hypothetical protein